MVALEIRRADERLCVVAGAAGHRFHVLAVNFAPTGVALASAGMDNTVSVTRNATPRRTFLRGRECAKPVIHRKVRLAIVALNHCSFWFGGIVRVAVAGTAGGRSLARVKRTCVVNVMRLRAAAWKLEARVSNKRSDGQVMFAKQEHDGVRAERGRDDGRGEVNERPVRVARGF